MKENKLMATILVAALLVAGSLVFLGLRMSGNGSNGSQQSFAEQLKDYEAAQQQVQLDAQADAERAQAEQAKNVPERTDADHVNGNPDALITIFEYSDFECPFCKRFYETPDKLVKNNDGKVNSVYRHFPLGFHDPLATTEAIASECAADQGKFWEMHDVIFATTDSNGRGLEVSELYTFAKDLGLKASTFKACLDSRKHLDKIQADMTGGAASGVTGTPGSIIKNNKTGEVRFISGAYPIESLQAAINELL